MPDINNNLKNKTGDDVLISWTFPEFVKHQRSKWWYVITFTLSALLLLFAILTANWLFALIIIMIDAILMLMHNKSPAKIEFSITQDAIQVSQKSFFYGDLESFWLIYEPPEVKNLYFSFKSKIKPGLTIPLDDINPLKVRQILLRFLDEDIDKENEPTSETLARMLKI